MSTGMQTGSYKAVTVAHRNRLTVYYESAQSVVSVLYSINTITCLPESVGTLVQVGEPTVERKAKRSLIDCSWLICNSSVSSM